MERVTKGFDCQTKRGKVHKNNIHIHYEIPAINIL